MNHDVAAYGLWSLVAIDSLVFVFFVFSFFQPKTRRDWRSFGALSAFIIALFTEMYGFPLTIYLLSGWLASRFPGVDFLSHDAGHLWYDLLGFKGDPHLNPLHLLSNVLIFGGFLLLASAWRVLHAAQQRGELAVTGAYSRVRHPQYDAFILIMVGFLLQWPTLPTLIMFPILVYTYARLARREEAEVRERFGDQWDRYAAKTPPFIPSGRGASGSLRNDGAARA
jgi:protein-S-isoprenylcysteine O-methyltransferase Ste14